MSIIDNKKDKASNNIQDFVIIIDKRDKERFRQFKIQYHQKILQSLKDIRYASNVWSINSHKDFDLWSRIKKDDRVFFAMNGSEFSHYGVVYKTLQDRKIVTKLWGNSPRILQHDCLILFSHVENISKPFHKTCNLAGIKQLARSEGVYLSKNLIMNSLQSDTVNAGTVLVFDDGPATKRSEVVTRFIRDTNKVRKIKKKYNNKCQICGYVIQLVDNTRYSEVHHIRPLKDGGDDNFANMIVLCPTHHVEFDYKIIAINKDRKTIIDKDGKTIGNITMLKGHTLHMKNINFHLAKMSKNEF